MSCEVWAISWGNFQSQSAHFRWLCDSVYVWCTCMFVNYVLLLGYRYKNFKCSYARSFGGNIFFLSQTKVMSKTMNQQNIRNERNKKKLLRVCFKLMTKLFWLFQDICWRCNEHGGWKTKLKVGKSLEFCFRLWHFYSFLLLFHFGKTTIKWL